MWRRIVVCFVATFCLAVLWNTNNAEAATDWPRFQERLKAGQSSSVNAASIPEDTVITPPDSSLSVKLTSYSGKWHGWMCRNAVASIEVAIKAISAENGTIGYAVATNERSSRYQEFEAKVDDGELIGNLRSGSEIIIGQREDGNLNIKWISGRNARRWCTGILARAGSSVLKHKHTGPGTSIMLETELQEDGKPIRLEYVVYKPAGDGPFPVLVFNHGSTGSGRNTDVFTRTWRANTIAGLFEEKGWAVVFPHRRGRGKSDGLYDEGFRDLRREGYACSPQLSLPGVDRALTDIEAAIKALDQLDYIDTKTIVIGGQSRGGILSMAYAGEHPEQVKGVINFVGGWIGERCDFASHINEKTFTRGSKFGHSTLWLYGKGDRFYSVDHSRSNFTAFESAGGKGSFHVYDVPGGAGHSLLYSPDLWRDEVIKYMQNIGFSDFETTVKETGSKVAERLASMKVTKGSEQAATAKAEQIPYMRVVTLSVGKTAIIHGARGKCGKPPSNWARVARGLPYSRTGSFSDGGLGTRWSRRCGGPTPARAVRFTAEKAGSEQIELYGDPISITVNLAHAGSESDANTDESMEMPGLSR